VRLFYDAGVYITPVLLGTAIFAAIPKLMCLALSPLVIHDLYSVGEYGTQDFEQRPYGATILAAMVGFIGTIIWRYYQQGPVEIVVDEQGITETEWGKPRVTIPWAEARAWSETKQARSKYGARFELTSLRFAAPSGDMITFNNVDSGLLIPALPRRMVARSTLGTFAALAAELPPLDKKVRDPRVREVMGGIVIRLLRVAIRRDRQHGPLRRLVPAVHHAAAPLPSPANTNRGRQERCRAGNRRSLPLGGGARRRPARSHASVRANQSARRVLRLRRRSHRAHRAAMVVAHRASVAVREARRRRMLGVAKGAGQGPRPQRSTISVTCAFFAHAATALISSSVAIPTHPSVVSKAFTSLPAHVSRLSGPCTPTALPV
jgi:hypothetical protein